MASNMFVTDGVDIAGYAQGNVVLAANTANQSPALDEGIYDVWVSSDTYVRVTTANAGVTTTTGYLHRANTTIPYRVPPRVTQTGPQFKIEGISVAGGTLSYHRVG